MAALRRRLPPRERRCRNGRAFALARARRDRRGTVEAGEAGLGEASDVADLDDDLGRGAGRDPDDLCERRVRLVDQGGELGGGRLVLLEDVAQHRHAVLDQPQPQGDRGVGYTRGVEPAERVHPGTHRLHRPELTAQVFGEIVHERIEFTEELDADLGEGLASVVPQGDPLTDRVRRRRHRLLERSCEAKIRLRLGSDPVGIEPVGLALVTAALAD